MNSKDTINHIKTITDVKVLQELLQTETRSTVITAISKRIEALTPSAKSDEKKVKVKLHTGETHECTEAEYLSAKEYYGDNYPGELISE